MGAAILSFARSFPVVFVKIMGKIVLDLVEGTIRTSTRDVSREYVHGPIPPGLIWLNKVTADHSKLPQRVLTLVNSMAYRETI